jgi:hypothetical protein
MVKARRIATLATMIPTHRSARWIALWVGIALLLRLVWVLHLPATDGQLAALPDQCEYLSLGRSLLAGRGLVLHDPRFNADVLAYRTPGYPIFIALLGGSVRAVRVAQAVLDSSTVLAVYLLARRWLAHERALLAAAIVAVNPWLIYFCGLVLAETLFTALLAWGLAMGSWGMIALIVSVMVRPSALLLPILLAGLNWRPGSAYDWRRAIIALAGLVLLLLPWAMRNHAVLGQWMWTTTNSGITMYDGFNPSADGGSNQRFVTAMPELATMGEVQRSRYLSRLAWEYITDHPGRAIELTLAKLARLWSPLPLSREYGRDLRYALVGLLYTVPLFVLIAAGLMAARLPVAAKVMLMLPAIYFTIVHAASVGSIRYRIPADVPMAIIAAAGIPLRRPAR